jgi:hypothetical protein
VIKKGDRVIRINQPQPKGINIGDKGTVLYVVANGCSVMWDNGIATGSFLTNVHPIVNSNKEAKSFLDKEW